MTFKDWWQSYKLPVISSRGTFDVLLKATRAAYNAGRRAEREEEQERRLKWTKQNNSYVSSGRSVNTGD